MATKDFSWTSGATEIASETMREALPNRVALTATEIFKDHEGRVLLVDPHPEGTWENWMLPYSSLILEKREIAEKHPDCKLLRLQADDSLESLEQALEEIVSLYATEYRHARVSGMNNILPHLSDRSVGEPAFTSYSLKFSKTSNNYTAYRFEYLLRREPAGPVSVPYIWIKPERLDDLDRDEILEGRRVSSNVLDVLPFISAK
jgi:hypothetical protein